MAGCIFIAGTDMEVGKTVVAAGLLRWFRGRGVDAVPMKPVETGVAAPAPAPAPAPGTPGTGCAAGDLRFCLDVAGLQPSAADLADMAPFQYAPACSPHLAGRLEGRYPDIDTILASAERLARRHELVLIEGAGGVLVPLNETQTTVDLIAAGRLPVILVARGGLGTINHTLLSIEALRGRGVDLLGVVFNDARQILESERFIHEDNPGTIERFGRVKVLGRVPRLDAPPEVPPPPDSPPPPGSPPAGSFRWELFDQQMTGLPDLLKGLNRHAP